MGLSESKRPPVELIINGELYRLGRTLGTGASSEVSVLFPSVRSDSPYFALKSISKWSLKDSSKRKRIKRERDILIKLNLSNSPFINNLLYTFQTDKEIHMLFNFLGGGTLDWLLQREQHLPLEHVAFYASQLVLAIEHLHAYGISHRDINPNNILFDCQGYCYLTDFDCAVWYEDDEHESVRGTFPYVAPEVLDENSNHKFGPELDYFSLGCVIFEMIQGKVPYEGRDRETFLKSLKQTQLNWLYFSHNARSLCQGLLCVDRKQRFGLSQTKNHPFFSKISWSDLRKKHLVPPRSFRNVTRNFPIDVALMDPQTEESVDINSSQKISKFCENWDWIPDKKKMEYNLLSNSEDLALFGLKIFKSQKKSKNSSKYTTTTSSSSSSSATSSLSSSSSDQITNDSSSSSSSSSSPSSQSGLIIYSLDHLPILDEFTTEIGSSLIRISPTLILYNGISHKISNFSLADSGSMTNIAQANDTHNKAPEDLNQNDGNENHFLENDNNDNEIKRNIIEHQSNPLNEEHENLNDENNNNNEENEEK